MQEFNPKELTKLYLPPKDSHKGQNGKVLVIAGSKLFHAAALWSLEAAAHLVDMVYFSSVTENNEIVQQAKKEFRNGIVIPRNKLDQYIQEADSILIGPGLPRVEGKEEDDDDTRELTKRLLTTFPDKRWVIDGGSLQVTETAWIPKNAILTPHVKEFETLFHHDLQRLNLETLQGLTLKEKGQIILSLSKKFHCVIVLKGQTDIICSPDRCVTIEGGNAGMTKGGTGDVLAGVAVGLYTKNDAFLSASAASFFNKRAAEKLFQTHGYWYTTSDLLNMIPQVMKDTVISLHDNPRTPLARI